jgi:hypothetical protein
MAEELVYPRIVYRGAPDTLGLGPHVGEDGKIAGETARCENADDWEEKQKQGWRLTSQLPEAVATKIPPAVAKATK